MAPLLTMLVAACTPLTTPATPLLRAQNATDGMRETLQLVYDQFTPQLMRAIAAADQAHPDDDEAYHHMIAAPERVLKALEAARLEHALLAVGVGIWEETGDDTRFHEALPCALVELGRLGELLAGALQESVRSALAELRAADSARDCRRLQ